MTAIQQPTLSAERLSELFLFEGERREMLEWLVPHCRLEQHRPDTLLLDPQSPQDRAFLILHGLVDVRIGAQAEQVIATLGDGQCVGEMSVIEGVAPSAKVTTRTACTTVAIEGAAFRAMLENSTVVARNLLKLLARRLRYDNQMVRHSLELQALSEQDARSDALTGLHNRRWLDETLMTTIEQHRGSGRRLTLLMLDIDRFKQFNDTHGHLAGDRALVCVADVIKSHIRVGDQAARFGGEEFLVILPNTGAAEARQIAGRLRLAIHRAPITGPGDERLPSVSVSIGLAEWCPAESSQALLARADEALYNAKRKGRNRVSISPQPDSCGEAPFALRRMR